MLTYIHQYLTNLHHYLSGKIDVLANHKMALWGTLELILIGLLPDWYDTSVFHQYTVVAKDIGIYVGLFMTSLPFVSWVWKNVIRRIFKKKNGNK